jgi:hypothetical protein
VGAGLTIDIQYDQIILLIMGLFMFVGATRGWHREFITSCVLCLLLIFLMNPILAAPVAEYFAKLVRLVVAFVKGYGNLDPGQLLERYEAVEVPFDASNPYMFLVIVLAGFVLLSYGTRSSGRPLTALSRLLGGLLGLCNGYLAVSLVKEYMLKHIQRAAPELAVAESPSQFAVAVSGLPSGGLLAGQGQQILALLLVIVTAVVLGRLSDRKSSSKK